MVTFREIVNEWKSTESPCKDREILRVCVGGWVVFVCAGVCVCMVVCLLRLCSVL